MPGEEWRRGVSGEEWRWGWPRGGVVVGCARRGVERCRGGVEERCVGGGVEERCVGRGVEVGCTLNWHCVGACVRVRVCMYVCMHVSVCVWVLLTDM